MKGVTKLCIGAGSVLGASALVWAQALPCKATAPTGNFACFDRALYIGLEACNFELAQDDGITKVVPAAQGKSSSGLHNAYCFGTYYTLDEQDECNVPHPIDWFSTGAEATGNDCPAPPPG